ncbi:MAG: M23 family metallopeptidase [Gemmatimonadetes bacterium]|nr:M23 family metallopeptidase [Gemmatimonadota bacterium]
MTEPRWTVLVVPHGPGKSKSLAVSRPALRIILGSALVLPLSALVLGYTTISKSVDIARLNHLDRQNQVLSQELRQTRQLINELTDTVKVISDRDRQFRIIAGLNPIDPGVQQAGIGGPSGEWPEREQLRSAGALGMEALNAHVDVSALIRQANLLARSFSEAADSAETQVDRLKRTPSIMPTRGFLTSQFASIRIHPIYQDARPHEGIDISQQMGAEIRASAGGIVSQVKLNEPGYGNLVAIDHGYGLVTRYAHCSRILVRPGQRVQRGQEIALVGSTGISTGPHLHYEVIVNGKHVDPRKYIFPESIVD